jgi:hypothetical protein
MLERLAIRRAELIKKFRVRLCEQHDLLASNKGVVDASKVDIIEAIQRDCEIALHSTDDLNSISVTLTRIDDLINNLALLVKKSEEIKTNGEDRICVIYDIPPFLMDENKLRDLFSPFGPIEKCCGIYSGFGKYIGSVYFTNSASAKRAATSLDNSTHGGGKISVVVKE